MTIVVLAQKWFSKRGGWPEPSKFAYFYENLLANCPYKMFFDVASLCNPANAALVETMSRMEEKMPPTSLKLPSEAKEVDHHQSKEVQKMFIKRFAN